MIYPLIMVPAMLFGSNGQSLQQLVCVLMWSVYDIHGPVLLHIVFLQMSRGLEDTDTKHFCCFSDKRISLFRIYSWELQEPDLTEYYSYWICLGCAASLHVLLCTSRERPQEYYCSSVIIAAFDWLFNSTLSIIISDRIPGSKSWNLLKKNTRGFVHVWNTICV